MQKAIIADSSCLILLDKIEELELLKPGEYTKIVIDFKVLKNITNVSFGLGFERTNHSDGFYINDMESIDKHTFQAGEHGSISAVLDHFPFLDGEFYLSAYVYNTKSTVSIDQRKFFKKCNVKPLKDVSHMGTIYVTSHWELNQNHD